MTKLAFAMSNGLLAGAIQSGTVEGAAWGAFSAGVFFGIGQAIQGADSLHNITATSRTLSGAGWAVKTVSHGLAGGTISHLQGGKFGHGFANSGTNSGTPTNSSSSARSDQPPGHPPTRKSGEWASPIGRAETAALARRVSTMRTPGHPTTPELGGDAGSVAELRPVREHHVEVGRGLVPVRVEAARGDQRGRGQLRVHPTSGTPTYAEVRRVGEPNWPSRDGRPPAQGVDDPVLRAWIQ
jgi:hypothetical protein